MWLSNERKHYRKSLRTKILSDALSKGEKLALELKVDMETGKQIFGITMQELFDLYIANREKDIGEGDGTITKGTWKTFPYKLKYGCEMLGWNTKVSFIKQGDLEDYRQRRTEQGHKSIQTILNEQSQLNAMWEMGYKLGHSTFRHLDFKKIKRRSKIEKQRATFTDSQYKNLYRYMRTWASAKECEDKEELLKRQMVQDMILILANTGMRIGEARQLRWGHLSDEQTIVNKETDKKTFLFVFIVCCTGTIITSYTILVAFFDIINFYILFVIEGSSSPKTFFFCVYHLQRQVCRICAKM